MSYWANSHKNHRHETIVRNDVAVISGHLLESLSLNKEYIVKDTSAHAGRLISDGVKDIWVSNTCFNKYFRH